MPERENFLTPEGLAKLEEELEYLRTVRRQEVAERIQQAKELRSAVNSPEYEDAKNEQGFVEGRILALEKIIKNAVIIHHEAADLVELGSKVTVRHQDGSEENYTIVDKPVSKPSEEKCTIIDKIVGEIVGRPSEGKISNVSPLGKALLGKRVGDEVKVFAPAGSLKVKIVGIS